MLQLVVGEVDGNDLSCAGGLGADEGCQADATESDDRDGRPDADLGRIDDRADAREHCAAEKGRLIEAESMDRS